MSDQLNLLAPDNLLDAEVWKRDNPHAWAMLVQLGKMDAARGRQSSMQWFIEWLRYPDTRPFHVHRTDPAFLVNHNVRSSLARLLMREHPEIVFEIRHANCDAPGVPNASPR